MYRRDGTDLLALVNCTAARAALTTACVGKWTWAKHIDLWQKTCAHQLLRVMYVHKCASIRLMREIHWLLKHNSIQCKIKALERVH